MHSNHLPQALLHIPLSSCKQDPNQPGTPNENRHRRSPSLDRNNVEHGGKPSEKQRAAEPPRGGRRDRLRGGAEGLHG